MRKKYISISLAFFRILVLILILFFKYGNQELKAQTIYEVKPGEDYRAVSTMLQSGDELVLHEGTYEGNVVINNSGLPDLPIIIRGYGHGEERPVLFWEGKNAVLFQINGSHVVLDFLEFRSKYVYATRIGASGAGKNIENVTIKNCVFYESGGGDISAYAPIPYYNINILDNYFIGPQTTPVYIGQHDGKVNITNFTFKGNVIDGSQIYGSETSIGYGIQLKLNVKSSVIENNYITNTKGPGIMIYGATEPDSQNANIVRNNIVVGSRNHPGIVAGGGPATITGNLTVSCNGGLSIQNYGGRNLLYNVVVINNTALCNSNYGMSFGNVQDITARNNIVITSDSSTAYSNNPNPGINNKIYDTSKELELIIRKELINVIPARNNLEKIWLRLSSGPLNQADVLEIMDLILGHKIPVQKLKKE